MTEFYYNCCTYCYMNINENREKILYIDTCTEQEKKPGFLIYPFLFKKKKNGENQMIFVFYKFLLLHH